MSDFSFPRSKRLLYAWQFRAFYTKSICVRMDECVVYRLPNSCGHFRLGMTLKIRSSSVGRNRIKRCIREVFRQYAKNPFDYNVIIPFHQKMNKDFIKRLRQALQNALFSGSI